MTSSSELVEELSRTVLNVASVCNLVVVVGLQSLSLSVMIVTAIITLPVVSTAPSMAEGHASVEPASGAEKAPTARPEALEPKA